MYPFQPFLIVQILKRSCTEILTVEPSSVCVNGKQILLLKSVPWALHRQFYYMQNPCLKFCRRYCKHISVLSSCISWVTRRSPLWKIIEQRTLFFSFQLWLSRKKSRGNWLNKAVSPSLIFYVFYIPQSPLTSSLEGTVSAWDEAMQASSAASLLTSIPSVSDATALSSQVLYCKIKSLHFKMFIKFQTSLSWKLKKKKNGFFFVRIQQSYIMCICDRPQKASRLCSVNLCCSHWQFKFSLETQTC